MRQRFENSGTFLNEATRLLILFVALQTARAHPMTLSCTIQFLRILQS